MIYNYHTHTYRCGHASGSEEEYIKRAIRNGIKYMGFSDHAPFIFPNGQQSKFRVPVSKATEYFTVLSELREKYKNQIDIKIGFEMEYYPAYFGDMLKKAVELGAEYLILGEHFLGEEFPNGIPSVRKNDSEEHLLKYVSYLVTAIRTGVFTYVAHPDIFNFTGKLNIYEAAVRKVCVASRECGIPLEINFLGIRDNRNYPNETFWRIAGQERSPVTFGFDAHDVKSAYDGESLIKAKMLVKKYNLNYIGAPKIILLKKTTYTEY